MFTIFFKYFYDRLFVKRVKKIARLILKFLLMFKMALATFKGVRIQSEGGTGRLWGAGEGGARRPIFKNLVNCY